MEIEFFKYNGTGNDFVMIDNRNNIFDGSNKTLIKHLCTRHFGIGADGLILLENDTKYDFKMVYFNSDGSESTMCGNGGRCIIQFAHDLGVIGNSTEFIAIDGPHKGKVHADFVALEMIDVNEIEDTSIYTELDTGSPHYVSFMDTIPDSFVEDARKVRNSQTYVKEGINVNFATVSNNTIKMRTFERGVENETLACGTGATAVAIAAHHKGLISETTIPVEVEGGNLTIQVEENNGKYSNVWLNGPAKYVFKGTVKL